MAHVKALPEPYRATVDAIERYLMHLGRDPHRLEPGGTDVLDDLAELFERAAADGTPVRDIEGDDPIEFVETFVATYSDGGWVEKERQRLPREHRPLLQGRGASRERRHPDRRAAKVERNLEC